VTIFYFLKLKIRKFGKQLNTILNQERIQKVIIGRAIDASQGKFFSGD